MMRRTLFVVVVVGCLGTLPFGCTSKSSSSGDTGPSLPDGPIPAGTRCGPPGGDTTTPTSGPKFCELPGTDAPEITVPDGFCVREFTTTPVMETRVMRFAPNGDLFVAAPSAGTPGGSRGGPG